MDNEPLNPEADPAQMILASQRGAVATAIGSLDADPEQAARSLELSGATGVPAPIINSNLEGFEQQHKASLTASLLNNNQYLQTFINSNPMAAKVANGDYASLDKLSQSISSASWLHRTADALDLSKYAFPAGADPLARFKEGGLIGDTGASLADLQNHPFASSIAAAIATPLDLFFRGVGGTLRTGADMVKNLATAAGGESLGREVGGIAETEAFGLSGRPHGELGGAARYNEHLTQSHDLASVNLWLKNQHEPPQTILPEYDKYLADRNAKEVDELGEITKNAQEPFIKEAAPDLLKQFIDQHTPASIGVSGEAVAKLYGDKLPTPDDNLLGWVPGIEDKLNLARATGDDVSIPISDWLSKGGNEVFPELKDDIRTQPNGITANEAKLGSEQAAVSPPAEPLPELVPQTRAASALEPLFSVGDRNLKIERLKGTEGAMFGPEQGFHDFSINDQNGNPVGTINLSEQRGGKDIYVEMINGIGGLGPRDFGPRLMFDLKRQLKAEFPQAERIGGHRVSGMREKFGTEMGPTSSVWVKLDRGDEDGFRQILENSGHWETYSPNIKGYIKPDVARSVEDRKLAQIVNDEADRIASKKLTVQVVDSIKADATGIEGQHAGEDIRVGGTYIRYKDTYPIILAALDARDTLGTFRHEVIHHFRQYGFFDKEEWSTLENEALAGGWLKKYNIDNRYPTGSPSLKLEESIAEAYMDWTKRQDALGERAAETALPPSPLDAIFQKLKDFLGGIKEKISQLLGKDATWEDVFARVHTGEVGGREGTEPLDPRAFNEKLSISSEQASKLKTVVTPIRSHMMEEGEGTYRALSIENQQGKQLVQAVLMPYKDGYHVGTIDNMTRYQGEHIRGLGEYTYEEAAKWAESQGKKLYAGASEDTSAAAKSAHQRLEDRGLASPANVNGVRQIYTTPQLGEKLSVAEPLEPTSRVFERAAALGMTVDQFKRYDELIAKRHTEDVTEATKRATEEQAREQTKQWKEDRKALRPEVADNIRQRPDVAADLFFGSGELYGKKVPLGSVKLDADALSEAQKAGLPRNYYGEHGLHPDDVANLFGYGSGDAMIDRLVQYNAAKLQAGGMSAKDFVSRVTDIETDRQMKMKYGALEDNIVDAVKEQVNGETQQNILHEETVKLGMEAKKAPLDKATILKQLRDAFAKMPIGSVSSDSYMRAAGKAGRAAEFGHLNNDPEAAFRAKQQQYYATVIANEASKLENQIGKFDKIAKRFSKREVPAVDQEYTNFIHDILMRVGKPVRRSVQDLEGEIAASEEYNDLKSFVENKNSFYLREVAVSEALQDSSFRKAFDDLTVDEFRGVDMSIRSLVANGRDEKKITKAGVAADLAVIKGQMIDQLKAFDEKTFDAKGGRKMGVIPANVATGLRTYGIDHLQMETIFNRWDNADPNGVFQQYVLRDLVDASNSESAKRKTYAARLLELDDKADLKKSVDNPLFKAPGTDQLLPFTRANLRAILLNAGNPSNLLKMAKGYNIPSEMLTAWLHTHATKEDWDWGQKMGDIFADVKKEADVMYRNLSGVAAESIKLEPIDTPHGQYPGWYYPLIAHPEFEGGVKKMMGKDALEQAGFVRATTANGYTKARTGATYPLALDLDMLPYRLGQMIHDVEMRPAVVNASKIFYDKDVRQVIANHFGHEWRDMLTPYLIDVANAANYTTKAQKEMASWSEFFRQNLITTLVGLNPGTFLKHTPTAFVQSVREVGADRFLQAVRGLWTVNERTGESNWQFARSTSQELQRRHSHFMETLGGAADALVPQKGFASLRQTVNYYASAPVAMGDLASAVPTWLAQYGKSIEEGATHGDAAYMADRSVRRAHGSTAITNRSAVMRGGSYSPWLASVYGFFNHIMNRQYEMIWKSGEALDMAKDGQYSAAMKAGAGVTASLFAYVIAPAIIEEVLAPQQSQPGDSWGKKAAKSLTFTLGASWVGIRDLTNAMLNGRDPTMGLAGTSLKTLTDVVRDASKDKPLSTAHAGKTIRDATMLAGSLTGMVPAQAGRLAQFGHGVATGQERPKGPWGWLTGARYGTIQGHPSTFQDWQRHHLGGR